VIEEKTQPSQCAETITRPPQCVQNKRITFCAKTNTQLPSHFVQKQTHRHLNACKNKHTLYCVQKQTHNRNIVSCRIKNRATAFILTPNAIVCIHAVFTLSTEIILILYPLQIN
jgi:hypothetical protein